MGPSEQRMMMPTAAERKAAVEGAGEEGGGEGSRTQTFSEEG